jgi:hypothetical protein
MSIAHAIVSGSLLQVMKASRVNCRLRYRAAGSSCTQRQMALRTYHSAPKKQTFLTSGALAVSCLSLVHMSDAIQSACAMQRKLVRV